MPKKYLQVKNIMLISMLFLFACNMNELSEKIVFIENQQWNQTKIITHDFNVDDSNAHYLLYYTIRHFNAYHYKNIWIDVLHKNPDSTTTEIKYEIPLANDNEGWLGVGMYDVYYHQVLLNKKPIHLQKGKHQFIIKHLMRENPLDYVLYSGFKIIKIHEEAFKN